MRHDPDVSMEELAWNRLRGPYWFHYTTPPYSRQIMRQRAFKVGRSTPAGLYVTDVRPGEFEDDKLLNLLFDGTRSVDRVQSAIVLHDDPSLNLEPAGKRAYFHPARRGSLIDLDEILIGRAYKQDGVWHYDRSLWDF